MNTTKLAIASAVCALSAISRPLETLAGEAVVTFKVPNSAYAFEPAPPCAGWRQSFHELMRDEEFVSSVSTVNLIAGAVVATIGFYDGISAKHGGVISEFIRKIHGGSYSSCLSTVYMIPQGATLGYLELSDRNGASAKRIPLNVGYWPLVAPSDDWSAWCDVEVSQADGRYFVTATAMNWLHNGGTNQTMKITWSSASDSSDGVRQSYEIRGVLPPAKPKQVKEPRGEPQNDTHNIK